MKWVLAIAMAFCFTLAMTPGSALAQETPVDAPRRIVSRVPPEYPELAKKMGLQGAVKLLVTVAPDGTPKVVEIGGGHPVLAKAAENAVYKWRWVPAHESREVVEIRFQAQ